MNLKYQNIFRICQAQRNKDGINDTSINLEYAFILFIVSLKVICNNFGAAST